MRKIVRMRVIDRPVVEKAMKSLTDSLVDVAGDIIAMTIPASMVEKLEGKMLTHATIHEAAVRLVRKCYERVADDMQATEEDDVLMEVGHVMSSVENVFNELIGKIQRCRDRNEYFELEEEEGDSGDPLDSFTPEES